ncbi:hypothetical protein C7212DRAFT_329104 [Tuber magnatum]|uniref:Secreted protein n=1 Tax=Tuber magnatum TaxID=42249 RepID=A0A317SMB6_9PEZI|nr:hypothetical protein C7212DRAFT_329104 [Tuber magnatum]
MRFSAAVFCLLLRPFPSNLLGEEGCGFFFGYRCGAVPHTHPFRIQSIDPYVFYLFPRPERKRILSYTVGW